MAFSSLETHYQENKNMAWPVTRHTQIPLEGDFRRVAYGIDSLDIGFFVQWNGHWDRLSRGLQIKKEEARGEEGIKDQTPSGRPFFHLPTGKAPNYRYHLKFPEYHLYLSITNPPGESPNVYVSILSESLWCKGVRESVQQVTEDLQEFHGDIFKVLVSRCDVCADFLLPEDPTLEFIKSHMVTRVNKTNHYEDNGVLETFYAGKRGAKIQLRIYNKGKTLKSDDKLWFLKQWELEKPDGVWRIEFQLNRTALKEHSINTLEELLDNVPALWEYLTGEWFSLRYQDNTKQERRTVHPWWKEVHATKQDFGEIIPLNRIKESDLLPSVGWFIQHIGGMLPSYAARKGIRHMNEAAHEMMCDITLYWLDKDFYDKYDKRLLRLGFTAYNEMMEGRKNG